MELGLTIKKLRKNKELKQRNLSEIMGVSQGYLSLIEKGNKEPSLKMLKKIAGALNVPVSILFWISLTEEDIDINKREIFKTLKPSIDALVFTLLNNN